MHQNRLSNTWKKYENFYETTVSKQKDERKYQMNYKRQSITFQFEENPFSKILQGIATNYFLI